MSSWRVAAAVVAAIATGDRVDAVHEAPVWREKANFIIGAPLPEEGRAEQLWARRLGERRFEVCCIPFFLYDVALGDVVETDAAHDIVRVLERSGRFVFRVYVGDAGATSQAIADELERRGALIEWSSTNLLAVDATDERHAQTLADHLAAQERRGALTYETGRS